MHLSIVINYAQYYDYKPQIITEFIIKKLTFCQHYEYEIFRNSLNYLAQLVIRNYDT